METEQFGIVVEDITACLFALCNALEAKGLLTKAEMRAAFQERLVRISVDLQHDGQAHLLPALRALATMPDQNEANGAG